MADKQRYHHCQFIRGYPFPTVWKNVEDTMDFKPDDGDILIASHPKTGSTWMSYIVLQIKSKGQLCPTGDEVLWKLVPHLPMTGLSVLQEQTEPRIYRHHVPYNLFQKNGRSKCIYTYRHPEDAAVSYYHFTRYFYSNHSLEFDEYFDNFVTGKKMYGNYFEHVLEFYKHRQDENLLMVSYEELHANTRGEILRIAKFLSQEDYQNISENEEILDEIMEHTSFDYMKKNASFNDTVIKLGIQATTNEFYRKGIVGDGRAVLTDEQRKRLKEAAEKVLAGTTIMKEWYSE